MAGCHHERLDCTALMQGGASIIGESKALHSTAQHNTAQQIWSPMCDVGG